MRALLLGLAGLGLVQVAAAQDRAPTVPETIVEGMEVVDPLAFQATAAAWNKKFAKSSVTLRKR